MTSVVTLPGLALEYQRTLNALFVGKKHDMTDVSACAPPCFGNKGSKFRQANAFVDLLHRPLDALLLLLFSDSLAGHGYP